MTVNKPKLLKAEVNLFFVMGCFCCLFLSQRGAANSSLAKPLLHTTDSGWVIDWAKSEAYRAVRLHVSDVDSFNRAELQANEALKTIDLDEYLTTKASSDWRRHLKARSTTYYSDGTIKLEHYIRLSDYVEKKFDNHASQLKNKPKLRFTAVIFEVDGEVMSPPPYFFKLIDQNDHLLFSTNQMEAAAYKRFFTAKWYKKEQKLGRARPIGGAKPLELAVEFRPPHFFVLDRTAWGAARRELKHFLASGKALFLLE